MILQKQIEIQKPAPAQVQVPHIITVVRDPRRRLGKQFDLAADGKTNKHSVVDVSVGMAKQHYVPDAETFSELLRKVSDDEHAAILNSYFPEIPVGQSFLILSEREMEERGLGATREERVGVKRGAFEVFGNKFEIAVGRLKANLRPSSWQLLDRDVDEFTPDAFGKGMDRATWLSKAAEILPGLENASRVYCSSASARVIESAGQAVGSGNGHTWVQVSDADDVERARPALLQRALEVGAVWKKPRRSRKTGEEIGSSTATIIDTSVLVPGRLVFCGKPYAPDFKIIDQEIRVENPTGGVVDTGSVQLDRQEFKRITTEFGTPMSVRGEGSSMAIDAYDLSNDTELELEGGRVITVSEAMGMRSAYPEGKIRCQAPFRASKSEAAFFNIGNDGRPFVHDIGTGTTHWLNDDEQVASEFEDIDAPMREAGRQFVASLKSNVASMLYSEAEIQDMTRLYGSVLPEDEASELITLAAPVANKSVEELKRSIAPAGEIEPELETYAYDVLQLKPVEFVVDGFLPVGLTVIAGSPGVGKTSLLVPLAAAVAHLYETNLVPILRRKVVYISESPAQVQSVLYGLAKHAPGAKVKEFPEMFKIVPARRLMPVKLGKLIRRVVREHMLDHNGYQVAPLIVLDTSNANIELDNENDNSETGKAIAAIRQNLGAAGCWLVHHTPKSQKNASADDMTIRGAGAFGGDAETTAFIASEEGVLDKRFMKLDKHRFVPLYRELEFDTEVDSEVVPTPWGEPQEIVYRYGMPTRSSAAARQAQVAVAKEQRVTARKGEMATRVLDFLRENGASSMRQVHEHIKGKREPLYELMRQMDSDGRLERSGEFLGGHPIFKAPDEFGPINLEGNSK